MASETLKRLMDFDQQAASGLRGLLAGVDEAGRGPLAGPVVAAAVIFLQKPSFKTLNDSKKLSPKTRETLFREIARISVVGIGVANEKTIDDINIYQASRLAMKRALLALNRTPDLVLIDGNMRLDIPLMQQAIIKGDQKSASIAAASIIAKVYRDAWMTYLDQLYPHYLFHQHKGYPTPLHLQKLRENGASPVHRRSFAPVRENETRVSV